MKNIIHFFPTFRIGGSQKRLSLLINNSSQNCKHIIISLDGDLEAAQLLESKKNVEFHKFENYYDGGLFHKICMVKKYLQSNKNNVDLLCTYNWGSFYIAFLAFFILKVKIIHHEDGFGSEEIKKLKPIRNFFRMIIFNFFPIKLIVPSKTLKSISEQKWKIPKNKIFYIKNSVENGKSKKKNKIKKNVTNILVISRIGKDENISKILNIFTEQKKVKNIKVTIIGGISDNELLNSYKKYSDLFEFKKNTKNIEEEFYNADIFLLLSNSEQAPLTLLEAMAYELPIIANDVGDIKDMLSKENQKYIIKKDWYNEKSKILSIIDLFQNTPEEKEIIVKANLKKLKNDFCFAEMLKKYEKIYEI